MLRRLLSSFRQPRRISHHRFEAPRNLYLSAYPRSGNTWISYLISFALNRPYWDIDGEELPVEREGLRNLLCGGHPHAVHPAYEWVLKTHAEPVDLAPKEADAVVYVVRDPRDVFTSYFHYVERQWSRSPRRWRRAMAKTGMLTMPQSTRLKLFLRWGVGEWVSQVRKALECDVVLVRYEDVRLDPECRIRDVLNQINATGIPDEVVASAVNHFEFSRMQQVAKSADPLGHSVRKGIIGDWENLFDEGDRKYIADTAGDMMSRLGYED